MNANDVKERAYSLFERLKVYTAYLIRYIVFICRKYPLVAILFLVVYSFFLFKLLTPMLSPNLSSNNRNLPIEQQNSSALNSNSTTTNLHDNTPSKTLNTSPVPIEPAQVSAVKSGSNLSLKWSESIEDPLIYSEKELLDSSCLSRRCQINLNEPISQVEVYWRQNGKRYVKNFKLAGTNIGNTASEEELKEQAVAQLEQKHKQLKLKRIEATKAVFFKGKVFEGTISFEEQSQPIKLTISEIIGDSYIVEVSNPINDEAAQIFEGEITEVFRPRDHGLYSVDYNPKKTSPFLLLKSRSPQSDLSDSIWKIYKKKTILLLKPTELGIDGLAELIESGSRDWDYRIVIRN